MLSLASSRNRREVGLVKMVVKGKQIRLQKSDDLDAAHNYKHLTPISRDKLLEYENLLLEDSVDVDYKNYILSMYPKEMRAKFKDEKHGYNSYYEEDEEEDDPGYMLILGRLKEHEKSYRIEYEENGLRAAIKYEGASSSDTECDQEPRKKLRSAMKQKDGPSNQTLRAENQGILDSYYTPSTKIKKVSRRRSRIKCKSKRGENAKLSAKRNVPRSAYLHPTRTPKGDSSSDRRVLRSATQQNNEHSNWMRDVCKADSQSTPTKKKTRKKLPIKFKGEKEEDIDELDPVRHTFSLNLQSSRNKSKRGHEEDIIQLDPDYHIFSQNLKLVDGNFVYMAGGNVVVYELKNGESARVREDDDDESYSDVEILDSTAFYKTNECSNSNRGDKTGQSEFRHKVITALKKPFDEEEFAKLWQDIKVHKPKERHIDLRCGRERPIGTQEDGKSYLDYYPALRTKLLQAQGNRPKCLNLLRGFFLWIKQPEAFCPWLDNECLAVYLRSS